MITNFLHKKQELKKCEPTIKWPLKSIISVVAQYI